jgi:RNA polymerase sigma-70 factor (ECF subfamily)
VAYRTALEARRAAARRRLKEASVMPRPEPTLDPWADLAGVLDQELSRLPERYRAPLLLCDVEGKTRKEAGLALGWPEGTVSSRLSRARAILARRLRRHGLGLADAAVPLMLGQVVRVCVPAPLAVSTVKAAMLISAGQSAGAGLSSGAVVLMERVVRAMGIVKFKVAVAVMLAAGLMGLAVFGAVAMGRSSAAPAVSAIPRDEARKPAREPREPKEVKREEKKEGVSVKDLPPVVVKTVPQAGDTKVDAARVKEVRVTFSKDMMDKSWTWSQISDETFPKVTGKVRYEKDRRTCVLPVKLEAGKTYAFWLNSEKFQNFKDRDGHPAVPYLLVFETKP